LRKEIELLGSSTKHVMMTVRLATTGRKVTPPLFESLSILGRDVTLHRIARAIEVLTFPSLEADSDFEPIA
jgi:glutamyl-tRNA synthetase